MLMASGSLDVNSLSDCSSLVRRAMEEIRSLLRAKGTPAIKRLAGSSEERLYPVLDSHCHLDRYPDPAAIGREAESKNAFVIAMTNLPSHFIMGLPHARQLKRVRLALGLHPLAVDNHEKELPGWRRCSTRLRLSERWA